MSIERAIQLSNQAVSCLETKCFDEAILSSCAAMEVFQQSRHMAEQVPSQQGNDFIDQCILTQGTKSSSDQTIIMDEFIYEHGIVLPMIAMDETVVTPVLIYNCALSHQLAARHCNDDRTHKVFLEKAASLYQIAFKEQDEGLNAIFKFAILNNIGVIHKMLDRSEAAKACFDYLVSWMMIYIHTDNSKYLRLVQGFWGNVLGNGRETAPAA
mmetsp:Transcript_35110/g.85052  ORF Transcript_35110/g.85052 Transcript_35110/m.85052 type:complete len:212 (-) Transcript_35110:128-763(-)|eukprot:CAMPEP_0113619742 /NCGR_PEP_ID=MMETSP0017_2-20120614/10037_1 /TAXON_ID=2856 /ORGANISM="Cylindrotheca closterium" /LENGTH=211 /DNA_ID=CAMNT_0000529347 /DNA_START=198 /DNA_END=833 /DNA_ORIENTATION=+ /assembly_acc=CAM_ASM_000147